MTGFSGDTELHNMSSDFKYTGISLQQCLQEMCKVHYMKGFPTPNAHYIQNIEPQRHKAPLSQFPFLYLRDKATDTYPNNSLMYTKLPP